MSFYDDDVLARLLLIEIDVGPQQHRFLAGIDGVFTDINKNQWVGSTLLNKPEMASVIGGNAPSGSLTVSYFQPQNGDDLIDQIQALGDDYVFGKPIRFYVQKLYTYEELWAPTVAPELRYTRTMRTLSFGASGAETRTITLTFESWTEDRRAVRRIAYNTEGHAKLLGGTANPSLTYMPTSLQEEEKLFG